MADKFLQVKMEDGSTMPLKIDSVVTIAGVEDTNAAKFTITYSNGGTAVLLSQAAEAAIDRSVEHYAKKVDFLKGPKVVKTFK